MIQLLVSVDRADTAVDCLGRQPIHINGNRQARSTAQVGRLVLALCLKVFQNFIFLSDEDLLDPVVQTERRR